MDALQRLWKGAGLFDVETRRIDVRRSFVDFEDFWSASTLSSSIAPVVTTMAPDDLAQLKEALRGRMPTDGAGRVVYGAWANAIKGSVPG